MDGLAPGLRLVTADGIAAVGATKLGGMPDLPPGLPWPHAKWPGYEHEAMTFFGQVALGELDPAVWPGPRTGLLSFFCRQSPEYYGVDVGGAARVLHLPGAGLEPREWPDTLFADFRLEERLATPVPALPDPERTRPDHRLLGQPDSVQEDALGDVVLMHVEDNRIPYTYESLRRLADGWRLLLQVAADHRLGCSFGDGGALYFGIPREDLPAGRFDRVQAASQSN